MSPAWAKWTTEAGWPASTARLWSPEAPNELLKLTPLPAAGLFEGRLQVFLVDGFGSGVADDVELAAARRARLESSSATATTSDENCDEQREKYGHGGRLNASPPGYLASVPHKRIPSYVD